MREVTEKRLEADYECSSFSLLHRSVWMEWKGRVSRVGTAKFVSRWLNSDSGSGSGSGSGQFARAKVDDEA